MKFKLTIFLFYFIFISQNLFALQLGKINVSSKQDEPLSAVIDVIFSKNDKAQNLKPAIASKENYDANGISRLPIHSDIKITLEESQKGAKIYLTSEEIVKDPFLDLLIQIDSEKGRVYREYTILLDPPSPKVIKKDEAEKKSDKIEKAVLKKEEVSLPEKLPEKKIQPPKEIVAKKEIVSEEPKSESVKPKKKYVKSVSGKTLYQIARENKPSGVTIEQMVLGIFKINPNAFSQNNVNTLIKNKRLKLPTLDYFDNHTHIEARKILREQNTEWKNKTQESIKPKNEKKVVNEDKAKIKELEKELIETKRKLDDATSLKIKPIDEISEIDISSKVDNSASKKENLANKDIEKKQKEKQKINTKEELEKVDDGVFISSISDIDENKIQEKEIDIQTSKGIETIHILLLILFFILLFGLFVVISRRKSFERAQKIKSFNQDSTRTNFEDSSNQNEIDNTKVNNEPLESQANNSDQEELNRNDSINSSPKVDVNDIENKNDIAQKPDEDDKKF
tara:strand:- start:11 stop:1540 length:1530 start_codon:yes stop_codon:yes gene_type:complete